MLTKCVNCGFYIRKDDEFCLNCGIQKPANPLYHSNFSLQRFVKIDVFLCVLFFLFSFVFFDHKFSFDSFLLALAVSTTLALLFESIISDIKAQKRQIERASENPDALYTKEKIIEKRVSELDGRGRQIAAVLDKIKITDGQNLQQVREKLLSAREIVFSQFARYELQKHKIELVRLQNSVTPYLFGLHGLNEPETEHGLAAVENTKQKIDKIRQNTTLHGGAEFPERVLPEKEIFLSQLEETEESCEKLREVLLSRQATRALRDIQPIDENLNLPGAKDLVHTAESFNIQTTLTDFSESFEELESEYRRLKTEDEVGEKLLEA